MALSFCHSPGQPPDQLLDAVPLVRSVMRCLALTNSFTIFFVSPRAAVLVSSSATPSLSFWFLDSSPRRPDSFDS